MADNGSNAVASVAIIILVIAALFAGYYYMQHNKTESPVAPTKVEVNVPSPSTGSSEKAS
jgi:hypothetical protein